MGPSPRTAILEKTGRLGKFFALPNTGKRRGVSQSRLLRGPLIRDNGRHGVRPVFKIDGV